MDTESRTCKYFARKRTRSKYFAGRVVKYFATSLSATLWDSNILLLLLGLNQYFTQTRYYFSISLFQKPENGQSTVQNFYI